MVARSLQLEKKHSDLDLSIEINLVEEDKENKEQRDQFRLENEHHQQLLSFV